MVLEWRFSRLVHADSSNLLVSGSLNFLGDPFFFILGNSGLLWLMVDWITVIFWESSHKRYDLLVIKWSAKLVVIHSILSKSDALWDSSSSVLDKFDWLSRELLEVKILFVIFNERGHHVEVVIVDLIEGLAIKDLAIGHVDVAVKFVHLWLIE